ncbi:hypothetical protein LJD19_001834 [Escherichia coli]|nr:hypothetical protein [Escherichia coli]
MQRTLVALAVAAASVISGSAMAWTANGTGGSVDLSGTLTPQDHVTPWEVAVGSVVDGLDGQVEKGARQVTVPVKQMISVLGIRTISKDAFNGANLITPQIDFKNAVDIDGFKAGDTTLTLDVMDKDSGSKIGKMTTTFTAAAAANWVTADGQKSKLRVIASTTGWGFYGGVAKDASGVSPSPGVTAKEVFPAAVANYNEQGIANWSNPAQIKFDVSDSTYSGYYASGIAVGKEINITLDNPASGDVPINWKATLPVTVSYQ